MKPSEQAFRKQVLLASLLIFFAIVCCRVAGTWIDNQSEPEDLYGPQTAAVEQTNAVLDATDAAEATQRFLNIKQTETIEASKVHMTLTAQANRIPHPPAIIFIDFPSRIPSDGTKVHGTIKFTDAGQDVVLVIADVLSANNFDDAEWDPRNDTKYNGDTGLIDYWTWCKGSQVVTQSIRLKDSNGDESPSVTVRFACK